MVEKLGITYRILEDEISGFVSRLRKEGYEAKVVGLSDEYGKWIISQDGKRVTDIHTDDGRHHRMTIPEDHELNAFIEEHYLALDPASR